MLAFDGQGGHITLLIISVISYVYYQISLKPIAKYIAYILIIPFILVIILSILGRVYNKYGNLRMRIYRLHLKLKRKKHQLKL
ncbi:MAG: hypothetical protein QT11_C0001G0756 [archaeon GW2011_AR20]|nr:MAG: hypothetical protein QT11_C0001G0756 [archaeon GW2011_AR20]